MSVRKIGPMFDGRAEHAVDQAAKDIERNIAQRAVTMIKARLGRSLKHPTGKYQGSIRIQKVSLSLQVNDSGIVYGTWLEGISSRNVPKTKFAGYHSFEESYAALDPKAVAIAESIVARHLGEMQ